MKTIFTLVCVLSVVHYAASQCSNLKQFSAKLVPSCEPEEVYVKWPNYEDPTSYYSCIGIGNPVATFCPNNQYFIYVLQECGGCTSYIPPPPCNDLKTQNLPVCVPIGSTNTPSPGENSTSPAGPSYPTPFYPSPPPSTTPPPSQTTAPPPSQTTAPPPSQTTAPPPSQTTASPPSQTTAPPPSQTTAPPPSQTTVPPPSQTTESPTSPEEPSGSDESNESTVAGPPVVQTPAPGVPMPPTDPPRPPVISESPPFSDESQ